MMTRPLQRDAETELCRRFFWICRNGASQHLYRLGKCIRPQALFALRAPCCRGVDGFGGRHIRYDFQIQRGAAQSIALKPNGKIEAGRKVRARGVVTITSLALLVWLIL
jgi:hypothetical protein